MENEKQKVLVSVELLNSVVDFLATFEIGFWPNWYFEKGSSYAPASQTSTTLSRFTPTCVGNTLWVMLITLRVTVHPHMRGEYFLQAFSRVPYCGSPPHAWGIRTKKRQRTTLHRFTPTCVGNTHHPVRFFDFYPVHPHMRGEYYRYPLDTLSIPGSPPHAWGILSLAMPDGWRNRFTPTCVGNTLPQRFELQRSPVHPHMRGEYRATSYPTDVRPGSPPHAWGIQTFPYLKCNTYRFTPTCVGNT